MLKILFMAVLSLNLAPYSVQDHRPNSGSHPSSYDSTSTTDNVERIATESQRNQTVLVAAASSNASVTQPTNATTPPAAKKMKKKKRVVKRKRKPSTAEKVADNVPAHSRHYNVNVPPADLRTAKSDMQILQFYAQPLNAIDVNVQPVNAYDYDSLAGTNAFSTLNQHSLFVANSNYMNPLPTVNTLPETAAPLPYKTLPQSEYVAYGGEMAPKPFSIKHINYNWNAPPMAEPHHHFKPLPILDPFNLYKRPRQPRYRGGGGGGGGGLPVHAQKIIATAKPVTGAAVSVLPPVSVTHVYKYTDDSGLKIPFLQPDDGLDDSIPILSAALDEHLHERITTNVGMKNYLTPPKLGQPFLYNVPTITLPPLANNELQLINKFNADLLQGQLRDAKNDAKSDELSETQEEKNYTDEDVKKALEYIRGLRSGKAKQTNRGTKKYRTNDANEATRSSTKRNKKTHQQENDYEADEAEGEEVEEEDDDDGGGGGRGRRGKKKRRKKPKKEYVFEEEDDFQIEPFIDDDKNQEESQKTIVKAERKDNVRSQESQIVPSVDDENAEFNFETDANIGNGDSDERVEFQMHGLKGPESYKFGYDTGKGENRQFRYEERDPEGRVKGHFGYYDKDGKLQVFNYEADPETGYHLEKASE